MSDGSHDDIFPTAPRPGSGPAERVTLEFDSFREFIDEYSPHISGEGIFLPDEVREVGSRIAFEVRLSDDFRLIHGTGSVEWVVDEDGPAGSRGSALRFDRLDEPSRRLVARLVDSHRGSGGEPFDIDRVPPTARAEPGESAPPEPPAGLSPVGAAGRETIAIPISRAGLSREPPEPPEAPGPKPPPIEDPPPEPEPPPVQEPPASDPPEPAPPVPPEPPREEPPSRTPPVEEPPAAMTGGPGSEPEELETVDGGTDEVPEFELGSETPEAPLMELDPLPPVGAGAAVEDLAAGLDDTGKEGPGVLRSGDLIAERTEREDPELDKPAEPPTEAPVPEPSAADDPFAGLGDPLPPAVDSGLDEEADAGSQSGDAAPLPPVEMPDPEDLTAAPYDAESRPRRASTFLWLALCALAVVLGAAAWRYREALTERFSDLVAGGTAGREVASVAGPPAAGAAAPPAEPEGMDGGQEEAGEEEGALAEVGSDDVAASGPPEEGGADETAGGELSSEAADPLSSPPPSPSAEPSPEPVVPPAEPAAAPVSSAVEGAEAAAEGRPTRLERIDFRRRGANTEIRVVADRPLDRDAFELIRVAAPPRQVLKIFGPGEPYPQERLVAGTSQVRRLRIGYHSSPAGGEIHIVADLESPDVRVLGVDLSGSTLTVTLGAS